MHKVIILGGPSQTPRIVDLTRLPGGINQVCDPSYTMRPTHPEPHISKKRHRMEGYNWSILNSSIVSTPRSLLDNNQYRREDTPIDNILNTHGERRKRTPRTPRDNANGSFLNSARSSNLLIAGGIDEEIPGVFGSREILNTAETESAAEHIESVLGTSHSKSTPKRNRSSDASGGKYILKKIFNIRPRGVDSSSLDSQCTPIDGWPVAKTKKKKKSKNTLPKNSMLKYSILKDNDITDVNNLAYDSKNPDSPRKSKARGQMTDATSRCNKKHNIMINNENSGIRSRSTMGKSHGSMGDVSTTSSSGSIDYRIKSKSKSRSKSKTDMTVDRDISYMGGIAADEYDIGSVKEQSFTIQEAGCDPLRVESSDSQSSGDYETAVDTKSRAFGLYMKSLSTKVGSKKFTKPVRSDSSSSHRRIKSEELLILSSRNDNSAPRIAEQLASDRMAAIRNIEDLHSKKIASPKTSREMRRGGKVALPELQPTTRRVIGLTRTVPTRYKDMHPYFSNALEAEVPAEPMKKMKTRSSIMSMRSKKKFI